MTSDYEVGYKKPPKHGQFKKGQSGNLGGRPRKLSKMMDDEVKSIMREFLRPIVEELVAELAPAIAAEASETTIRHLAEEARP